MAGCGVEMEDVVGIICSKHKKYYSHDHCPECSLDKERPGPTIISDIKPFVTDNITGKPVVVRSRRHKRILLRDHGLVEKDAMSNSKNRQRFKGGPGFEWKEGDNAR